MQSFNNANRFASVAHGIYSGSIPAFGAMPVSRRPVQNTVIPVNGTPVQHGAMQPILTNPIQGTPVQAPVNGSNAHVVGIDNFGPISPSGNSGGVRVTSSSPSNFFSGPSHLNNINQTE